MSDLPSLPPNPTVLPAELWRWVQGKIEERLETIVNEKKTSMEVYLTRGDVREMALCTVHSTNRLTGLDLEESLMGWELIIGAMLDTCDEKHIEILPLDKALWVSFDIARGTPFLQVSGNLDAGIRIRYTPERHDMIRELVMRIQKFYDEI